ncbi:RNA polymerase sigma factor [Tellurirhabdus rosea]|uniref:RNA polymerase sigma factor n=1 Tax=Tellurirhabdus rosea TaxID=2674997 RepID=UPI002253345C|nr:sigma-70 family RNA polymerase sigma factor [Tellurirhabdus rosea]
MDQNLIEQCQRGNAFAQKRLFDRYANRLYRVCLRYVRHEPEAEEVLMNGFLKIFRSIDGFRYQNENALEAWLRRIIVNEALQHLRARRSLPTFYAEDALAAEADPLPLPDAGLDADRITELIAQLPPGYRTVFNLYVVEGYNHREIAEQLRITENTSKSQLSKARAMLQDLLLKNGYEAERRRTH